MSYARPTAGGGVPTMQQSNIYVAYLPKSYTKTELEQLFLPYGAVLDAKILLGLYNNFEYFIFTIFSHVSFSYNMQLPLLSLITFAYSIDQILLRE